MGVGQFTDFSDGKMEFGNLVRNIYHEYQHLQIDYAAGGSNIINYALAEFEAHYYTLANRTLPQFCTEDAQSVIKMDEGYYNVLPNNFKTSTIEYMYNRLVRDFKPSAGMNPVENPNQFPPAIYRLDSSGHPVNIYRHQ